MKRPWLLILMACVLGELPVLLWDIQWGVFALLFVLWLFLAGFAFGGSGIKKKTVPGAVLFLTVFCLAFTQGLLTHLFAGRGALLEGSALRKPVRHRFRVRDVKTGEKGVEIYGGGLVLFAGEAPDLWRGDLIEALGIPEEIPPPKNPDAFDQRSYYRGLGITFRMQAMEVRLLKKSLVPDVFLALRRFFSRRLARRWP